MQVISNIYKSQFSVLATVSNDITSSKINNSQNVLLYNTASSVTTNMSSNQSVTIQNDPPLIVEVYRS
jgi:hypothetical protein